MSSKRTTATNNTPPKHKKLSNHSSIHPQQYNNNIANSENIPPSNKSITSTAKSTTKQPLQSILTADQCIVHANTLEHALQYQAADTVYMQALVTNIQPIDDIIQAYNAFKQRWSAYQLNSSLQSTPAQHTYQRTSAVQLQHSNNIAHNHYHTNTNDSAFMHSTAPTQRTPMIHTHQNGKLYIPPPKPIDFIRDYCIAYNESQLTYNDMECQFEEVRARQHANKYTASKSDDDCDMDFTVAISSHIHQISNKTQNITQLKQVQNSVVYNDMLDDSSDRVMRDKQVIVPIPTSVKKPNNPLIRTPRSAIQLIDSLPSPTMNTKYALDAVNSMFHHDTTITPASNDILLSGDINRPSPVAFDVYEDEITRNVQLPMNNNKSNTITNNNRKIIPVPDSENMPPSSAATSSRHSEQFSVYSDLTSSSTHLLKHNTGDKTREMLLSAQQPITPYSNANTLSSELDDSVNDENNNNPLQSHTRLTNDFELPRNSLAPIVELSHESDHSHHTEHMNTTAAVNNVASATQQQQECTVVDPYDTQHRAYVINELNVSTMPDVVNQQNIAFAIYNILNGNECDIELGTRLIHIESIVSTSTEAHTPCIMNVQDVDQQIDLQLSIYQPCNLWSFYISYAISTRLQDSSMFVLVNQLYHYSNCSIECSPLYDSITLQSCIQLYTHLNQCMDDTLVIYYTIEMLRCVAHLHAAQILHTNIQSNDFILLNKESVEWSDWCTGRMNGWQNKGLLLGNFNSCVDRTVFPESTTYLSSINPCDWQQLLSQSWCIECGINT